MNLTRHEGKTNPKKNRLMRRRRAPVADLLNQSPFSSKSHGKYDPVREDKKHKR